MAFDPCRRMPRWVPWTATDSGRSFGMDIRQAQRDVRAMYVGGFAGSLVSAALWLASAAAAT